VAVGAEAGGGFGRCAVGVADAFDGGAFVLVAWVGGGGGRGGGVGDHLAVGG